MATMGIILRSIRVVGEEDGARVLVKSRKKVDAPAALR